MRGYPGPPGPANGGLGSIPADAGLPIPRNPPASEVTVYPRGCGATLGPRKYRPGETGLSPRMRGYRGGDCRPCARMGSIPADAGLPSGFPSGSHYPEVYPRGCGATRASRRQQLLRWGLSPRMRGYHVGRQLQQTLPGSIPADAGLPIPSRKRRCSTRVYPRGCGATIRLPAKLVFKPGLSPRMRGYRRHPEDDVTSEGSIPADAGLPRPLQPLRCDLEVYPRGCGATRPRGLHG